MPEHAVTMIDVRGHATRVTRAGAGQTLLILSDMLGPQGWQPYMSKLSEKFAVIAPDHPGMGGDAIPEWLDRAADLANFYLDFLDAQNLKNVNLIGFGIGGWIAAELATRNCARLASLTLVAPLGMRVRGVPQADIFLGADDDVLRVLVSDQKFAEKLIADSLTPDNEDARLYNQQLVARLAWEPRLHDPQLGKWLHRISVPTQIIAGDSDKLFPRAYAETWQARISNARCEIIAGCGHLPHFEKVDDTVNCISRFVAAQGVTA